MTNEIRGSSQDTKEKEKENACNNRKSNKYIYRGSLPDNLSILFDLIKIDFFFDKWHCFNCLFVLLIC